MWLCPSFGRPEAPAKLLQAPGGMPSNVLVLVNEDDPCRDEYLDARRRTWPGTWDILIVPAGSRFASAVRFAFSTQGTAEPYWGIIDDDYFPVTPDWHRLMIEAAGPNGIAIANNLQNFPKPYCCRVMGGELARAIGTIAPGKMKHNFSDDAWGRFAEDFGLLKPLEHVIVEHRHHLFRPDVKKDATYERGSADFAEDKRLYEEWLYSDERREACKRVGKLVLGREISILDPRSVKLVVACPTHDSVDPIYHHSMAKLQIEAIRVGMPLIELGNYGGSHVAKVRERSLWNAWEHDPTHILWIDADMGFDNKQVFRLLQADVEFACAVGVRKVDELSLCCNFYPGDQILHPVNRFLKIKDVGFAFVLLKRSVIEKMIAAYPDLAYNAGPDKTEYALFLDMIDDRERLSEDYSFCRRWVAIGGEIWADRYSPLIHAGRKEYTGSIDDFFKGSEKVEMDIVRG